MREEDKAKALESAPTEVETTGRQSAGMCGLCGMQMFLDERPHHCPPAAREGEPRLGEVNLHHPDGPMILADGGQWVPLGTLQSRKKYPKLYALVGMTYCDEDLRCCGELFLAGPELKDGDFDGFKISGDSKHA